MSMEMLAVPNERTASNHSMDVPIDIEEVQPLQAPTQSDGFTHSPKVVCQTVQVDELEKALEQVFDSMCCRLFKEFKGILTERLQQVLMRSGDGDIGGVSRDRQQEQFEIMQPECMHPKPAVFDEVAELFKVIDKDGTGELQKAEMIRAFKLDKDVVAFCKQHNRLAPLLDPKTFGVTFANIDADNSGSIDLEEFRAAFEEGQTIRVPEQDGNSDVVMQLFCMLDSDGVGLVPKDQFVKALKLNHVVFGFCKQHDELISLLNPVIFKSSFSQIPGYDAKNISLRELRLAVNIIKKIKDPAIVLPSVDDEEPTSPLEVATSPALDAAHMKLKKELQKANAHHLDNSAIDQEVYNVEDFYWATGYAQGIARSELFINSTLAVISVNAVYLGVDADHNKAVLLLEADLGFILMEYFFCLYFVLEWIVRLCAFERKFNCLRDNWFKFDSVLVLLMVLETWVMPFVLPLISAGASPPPTGPLRLLRLLRLSRLVRLMRSLPELVIIVKGMLAAFRAVGSSLLMVGILVYLFAIVMHMLLKDDETEDVGDFFATLPRCMWTLLVHGTLLDDVATVLSLLVFRSDFNAVAAVGFFLVFILLTALTVMNMLIGVLCEVVATVSAHEKEEAAINVMRQTILLELKKYDDGDGFIDEDELNELMADPASVGVLDSLGIDVNFLQDLQVMTFHEPGASMGMKAVIEQMLTCRRDLPVTVNHLVMAHKLSHWQLCNTIEQHEERMKKKIVASLDEPTNH